MTVPGIPECINRCGRSRWHDNGMCGECYWEMRGTRFGPPAQDWCHRGHDMNDPANVARPNGQRYCRACHRDKASERRANDDRRL